MSTVTNVIDEDNRHMEMVQGIEKLKLYGRLPINTAHYDDTLHNRITEQGIVELKKLYNQIPIDERPCAPRPTPKQISDKRNSAKKRNKQKAKTQKNARKINRRK